MHFIFAVTCNLQLVFRTVGYSGADIRNLVNEAAIMSVCSNSVCSSRIHLFADLDKHCLHASENVYMDVQKM